MTYVPERASVNQRIQIGAESITALGTPVAASKQLLCYDFTPGVMADVKMYRATGHKYNTVQAENLEWVESGMSGPVDFNGLIYPLASALGSTTPVAHGVSSTAKDWIFNPPTSGGLVPQTYTFEQGDSTRAHKFAYGLFTEIAYKGTRKEFTCSGKIIGQPLTDAITMTGSPTAVALAPAPAKDWNVYLDPTFGALGTTLLTRALSIDFAMTGIYGPVYAINRANLGYTAHVDLAPATTFKLMLEANSDGMTFLNYLQSGATYFLRMDAQGLVLDNLQTVTLGTQSSGTFTLTYKGQTTTAIAYNATAATVQSALIALSTILTGNVTVTGSTGGPYSVIFAGTLAQDTTAMTGSGAALTTPANFLITQNQTKNEIIHDMAIKVSKPNPFKDDAGVFAIDWDLEIVEDATWGHAHQMTVTNLLTAL